MGRLAEKVLLKEYVLEVLKEDDGGVYGDLAMADAMQNPWGVSFGSGDELYNIFVQPFVDVVQTAAGKTKEMSQRAQTLLKVAFETVATTLVPVLTDSYNDIFKNEKEKLEKIKGEYAEVYQSNWDAFKDEDFQFLMFMYNPANYVLSKVAKKTPKVAIDLISTLTGGSVDEYLEPIKSALGDVGVGGKEGPHRKQKEKNLSGMGGGGGYGYDMGSNWDVGMESVGRKGRVIQEDDEQKQPDPMDRLKNPKLVQAINNSQLARKMRQQAQQLVREPLAKVFKEAQAVLSAKSVQDLQQKIGKPIKGADKLNQIEPKARQAAEQQLLAGVKKSMKTFYIKSLEQQGKKFAGSGVEQDYQKVISKIKAL